MSKQFDLGEFASPGKSNTRTATGQSFQLKFRDDTFTIANNKFKELGLEDHSLKMLISKSDSTVLFSIVGDADGDMLRRTPKTGLNKGKSFHSTVLEDALAKKGLLDKEAKGVNQLFNLEEGDAGGIKVYEVVAGTAVVPTPNQDAEGSGNIDQPTSQVADTGDLLGNSGVQQEEERF